MDYISEVSSPSCVQGNEGRLYEFIVRHFLACVSQDALGQETMVDIDIAQEKFSTAGLMIIARNYLDVYPYDRWSAKVCVCVCAVVHFTVKQNLYCERFGETALPTPLWCIKQQSGM